MRAFARTAAAAALLCSTLTACSGKQRGLFCSDDIDCDPSDLCIAGQCDAETAVAQGVSVAGDLSVAPAQQTLDAVVGQVPAVATVTLRDEDSIAHALVIGCSGGLPSPSTQHLAAGASVTLKIALPAPSTAGSSAITCTVTSASGGTAWTAFVITLHATDGGSGGGTGGGTAGGSGGGAGGGSGGGSGGGTAGGSGGGSGGGSAGGSGGGSAGGSGGGSGGGSAGGSGGGSGGGHSGGSGGGSAGGSGGGAGGGSGGGAGGGSGGGSAGGSGGGSAGVGPTGGTVDHLYFAVIGDSRPANIDDPTGYPTAVVTKIYQDIQATNPRPQFVVSTGDYMYANTNTGHAAGEAASYMAARAAYTGTLFPAMGNHECDGFTANNCTSLTQTDNIKAFMATILAPIHQTQPYYSIPINATDGSWTAKLVVVACNAWSTTQATWLTTTLAKPTTYTILVRHESGTATPAGPCQSAAETIMKTAAYDVSLVGHAHNFYASTGVKEVTVGNGGAPLSAGYSGNYGYATVEKVSGGFQVKNFDYSTGLQVNNYTIP